MLHASRHPRSQTAGTEPGDQLKKAAPRAPRPTSTVRMNLHEGRKGRTAGCTTGTTASKAPSGRPMPNRTSTPPWPVNEHPTPVDHTSDCSTTDSPKRAPPPVVQRSLADAEDDAVRWWASATTWASPGAPNRASAHHDHNDCAWPPVHPKVDATIQQDTKSARHLRSPYRGLTPFIWGEMCPFESTDKPAVRLCPFPLRPRRHEAYLRAPCGRGGIGRHARFRIWCRKAWGFESLRPHTAPLTRATTWKSHRKRSTTSTGS